MIGYRNNPKPLPVREPEEKTAWREKFCLGFAEVMARRLASVSDQQYEKAKKFDPTLLGAIMAREINLNEPRTFDVEPHGTLGVLAG